MSFTIDTQIEVYLLPGDRAAAEAVFLQHIADPSEMWIIAYSFTLVPMIDEILKNNSVGRPYHLYLDLSQSTGTAEKAQLQRLVDGGIEVTVGTSTSGPTYITHTKGLVCDDSPPMCWEGSVNFSQSGWLQVNTAMVFTSQAFRDAFVAQFNVLRDYAWTNERDKQLMKSPPEGVTIGTPVAPTAPPASSAPAKTPKPAKGAKPPKAPKPKKSVKPKKSAKPTKAAKDAKKAAKIEKKSARKAAKAAKSGRAT